MTGIAAFAPYESCLVGNDRRATAKALHLFVERRMPEMLGFARISASARAEVAGQLVALQRRVYALDAYGETMWRPNPDVLAHLWEGVEGALGAFGSRAPDLLGQIRSYQAVEADLRIGRLPSSVPIEAFYRLKTCDVRLARKLVTDCARDSTLAALTATWDDYDVVSEVCDDLLDVSEDMRGYNGNRFLIAASVEGWTRASHEYRLFLEMHDHSIIQKGQDALAAGWIEAYVVLTWSHARVLEALSALSTTSRRLAQCTPEVVQRTLATSTRDEQRAIASELQASQASGITWSGADESHPAAAQHGLVHDAIGRTSLAQYNP